MAQTAISKSAVAPYSDTRTERRGSVTLATAARNANPTLLSLVKGTATFAINKYSIIASCSPEIAVCNIIRVLLERYTNFEGLYPIDHVGTVLAGGIFLLGFMLSGVIADYKESEKIPGELATTLMGIEDSLCVFVPLKANGAPEFQPLAIRKDVLATTQAVLHWFGAGDEKDDGALLAAITRLHDVYAAQMLLAGPPIASRLGVDTSRLRALMVRASVISASTYLPSGYAIVELFTLVAYCMVVLAKYPSEPTCYAMITGVCIIYGGMLRLMRDVDDPFEYKPIHDTPVLDTSGRLIPYSDLTSLSPAHPRALPGGQDGGTEVMLDVLLAYRQQLQDRIAQDSAEEAERSSPNNPV